MVEEVFIDIGIVAVAPGSITTPVMSTDVHWQLGTDARILSACSVAFVIFTSDFTVVCGRTIPKLTWSGSSTTGPTRTGPEVFFPGGAWAAPAVFPRGAAAGAFCSGLAEVEVLATVAGSGLAWSHAPTATKAIDAASNSAAFPARMGTMQPRGVGIVLMSPRYAIGGGRTPRNRALQSQP